MGERKKSIITSCYYGETGTTPVTITRRGKRKAVVNFMDGTDMAQVNLVGVARGALNMVPGIHEVIIQQLDFTMKVTRNKVTMTSLLS